MSTKQLKSLLEDSWSLERAYLELLGECFERIYGDKSKQALNTIESDAGCYSEHMFLHSLSMLDKDFKEQAERRAKYHAEHPDEED